MVDRAAPDPQQVDRCRARGTRCGEVREFFVRTPCKSLDLVLFGIVDDQGNSVMVSSDEVLDTVADVAVLPRP